MGCCTSRRSTLKADTEHNPKSENIKTEKNNNSNEHLISDEVKINSNIIKKPPDIGQLKDRPILTYKTLTIVRKLNNCKDSIVHLMQNNIVRKTYPDTRDGRGQFRNEVLTYKRLRHCPFVLNILHMVPGELTFFLPYMPKKVEKTEYNKNVIKDYVFTLSKIHKLTRLVPVHMSNVVASLDNRIFMIDFGGVPIAYKPAGKVKWIVE